LALAILFSNITNYFLQIFIARKISVEDFATYNLLNSLIIVVLFPLQSLFFFFTKKISTLYNSNKLFLNKFLLSIIKFAVILSLLEILIAIFIFKFFYNLKITLLIIILNIIFFSNILLIFQAYFIGRNLFKYNAYLNYLMSITKIFLIYFFINFSLYGIFFSINLSILFALIFSLFILYKKSNYKLLWRKINTNFLLTYKKDIIRSFVYSGTLIMLTQIDIIIVSRIYSEDFLAIFSAAAILGKLIIFLPGILSYTLIPRINEKILFIKKNQDFIITLIFTILSSILVCLFFYNYSYEFLRLIYGDKYLLSASILKYISFFYFPMSVLTIIFPYFYTINSDFFFYSTIFLFVILFFLLFFANNYLSVLFMIFAVTFLLCISGLIARFNFSK
jgi:O-antigen/teichoic acid export membrane protein